jgi:hypothetical protein
MVRYQEKEIVLPELESLPDVKGFAWTQRETEIVWKYRHKDLSKVGKAIGRTRDACAAKIKSLRRAGREED